MDMHAARFHTIVRHRSQIRVPLLHEMLLAPLPKRLMRRQQPYRAYRIEKHLNVQEERGLVGPSDAAVGMDLDTESLDVVGAVGSPRKI